MTEAVDVEHLKFDPVTREPIDQGRLTREQKRAISEDSLARPKPSWLKVRLPGGGAFRDVSQIVEAQGLHTICQEARCPNIGECWGKGTATFQILGDICTRACRYCNVTTGRPLGAPDPLEAGRLAHAIHRMGVRHAVITSVDRDDLEDRGSGQFARTVHAIRRRCPDTTIELLVPDFAGHEEEGMRTVIAACPDVYSHNTETVRRLYRRLRPNGDYDRALWILGRAKDVAAELGQPSLMTKTGLIAGMGETIDELKVAMADIRERGVDVVTVGQYLRPTRRHVPVDRYYTPDQFGELERHGLELGFGSVFAGPLVRSSYRAEEQRFAAITSAGAAASSSQ